MRDVRERITLIFDIILKVTYYFSEKETHCILENPELYTLKGRIKKTTTKKGEFYDIRITENLFTDN